MQSAKSFMRRRATRTRRASNASALKASTDANGAPADDASGGGRLPIPVLTVDERRAIASVLQKYGCRADRVMEMLMDLNLCPPHRIDPADYGEAVADTISQAQMVRIVEQVWAERLEANTTQHAVRNAFDAAHELFDGSSPRSTSGGDATTSAAPLAAEPSTSAQPAATVARIPHPPPSSLSKSVVDRQLKAEQAAETLRSVLAPVADAPFDAVNDLLTANDEDDEMVSKAFRRIGATVNDLGKHILDNERLRRRCHDVGLDDSETQAVVNLFDDDCSGEIVYAEFRRIVRSNWVELGLPDDLVPCVSRVIGISQSDRAKVMVLEQMKEAAEAASQNTMVFGRSVPLHKAIRQDKDAASAANHADKNGSLDRSRHDSDDPTRLRSDMQQSVGVCKQSWKETDLSTALRQLHRTAVAMMHKPPPVTEEHLKVPLVDLHRDVQPHPKSYEGRRRQRKQKFDPDAHRQKREQILQHRAANDPMGSTTAPYSARSAPTDSQQQPHNKSSVERLPPVSARSSGEAVAPKPASMTTPDASPQQAVEQQRSPTGKRPSVLERFAPSEAALIMLSSRAAQRTGRLPALAEDVLTIQRDDHFAAPIKSPLTNQAERLELNATTAIQNAHFRMAFFGEQARLAKERYDDDVKWKRPRFGH